jgi:hypothetical protein
VEKEKNTNQENKSRIPPKKKALVILIVLASSELENKEL